MNHKIIAFLIVLCLTFPSCINDVVENFRTAEEDGITTYLKKKPEYYSEFLKLMNATGIDDLLDARGNYSCFIPVNEAVLHYYEEKGTDFDQLTEEAIKEIVYCHIIRQESPTALPLTTNLFPNGTISLPNMLGKFIQTTFDEEGIWVNQSARILIPDQDRDEYNIYNGVIHTIDKVLEPSHGRLPGLILAQERYSLFAEALVATGLIDSLEAYIIEEYDRKYKANEIPEKIVSWSTFNNELGYGAVGSGTLITPTSWNVGFTVLMESDEVYRNHPGFSIQTLDDLRQFAEDQMVPKNPGVYNDLKHRENSLNRFIAYHILDRIMDISDFIPALWNVYYVQGAMESGLMNDYSLTLDPYGMVEMQRDRSGPILNRQSDGTAVHILQESDNRAENGMFHGLDRILVYSKNVEEDVLNKRIRIDAISLLPELHTNRYKGNASNDNKNGLIFPKGYLKNLVHVAEASQIQYGAMPLGRSWDDLHFDELLIVEKFDVKLRLPPVPEGLYEIRIGYTAHDNRGILQIFLDDQPLGIPLNMRLNATDPSIGYVKPDPGSDDPDGYENDKMMRNRGYMKGPNSILSCRNPQVPLRELDRAIRRILTTDRLDRGEHWLRFRSVEESKGSIFMLDYIELVPSSFWEKEGID